MCFQKDNFPFVYKQNNGVEIQKKGIQKKIWPKYAQNLQCNDDLLQKSNELTNYLQGSPTFRQWSINQQTIGAEIN
jgi:hypothetical protein